MRRAAGWLVVLLLCAAVAPAGEPLPPVAILGAIEMETQPVAAALADRETVSVLSVPFVVGKLDGRTLVLAATGVGKVNAGMTTALLLERFAPVAVVFAGIAGALDPQLEPGDVVVGERLVQHDLVNHTETGAVLRSVRNPATGTSNPILLEASPKLLAIAREVARHSPLEALPAGSGSRSPRLLFGTIATGDSFVGSHAKRGELREQLGAAAVEMEGAAVAQVCYQHGVPFLVVRGVSDRAGNDARSEAQRNLARAARNAAETALAIVRRLGVERP